MLSMKSVAAALVLVASAADVVAPALVAPAVVLGVSTAAKAAPAATEVRHQVVRYGDLNLATPNGMAAFRARLRGAVETVCGPQADLRNFDEARDYKACVARASRDAMSSLPKVRQQASESVSYAG